MTDSEAIGFIQGKLDCMKKCDLFNKEDNTSDNDCDNCEYCYSQGNFVEQKEAFQMALQALEKQIPKKTVHDGCFDSKGMWHEWNGINGRPYDLCPNCNTNLCCEMPCDSKPNYCIKCGCRLDWCDDNDDR